MRNFSKIILTFIFLLTPFFVNLGSVNALSCVEFQGYDVAFKQSDLVFQGTVIAVENDSNGGQIYTFQVTRSWTPGTSSEVTLFQSETELMWSYGFNEGEEYVVFATLNEDLNPHLPLCGTYINLSSAESSEYAKLISEIGEPVQVEPGTGISEDVKDEDVSKVLIGLIFFLPLVIILGSLGYLQYKGRKSN